MRHGGDELEFVIHKHDASHLHYDLRLELDGVLKSWALPKGPSLNPSDRHLAIMVEDHPFDYKNFEGVIPKGNYGAGTVMIWDKGTYSVPEVEARKDSEDRIREGLKKGHITFILNGSKLRGEFALVKLKRSREENAWLLIKAKDDFATNENVLNKARSSFSNKTMDEISEEKDSLWFADDGKIDLSNIPVGDMLRSVKPMMATLIDKPFSKEGWFFEIKWDGYRAITQIKDNNVLIYSRNGKSFNEKFYNIVNTLTGFPHDAVFDGEVVVFDSTGKPNFNLVQNYPGNGGTLVYYLFDLLFLDSHVLEHEPLSFRRQVLEEVLPDSALIKLSDVIETDGNQFYEAVKNQGLEGMIAKDMKSYYKEGIRSTDWLKVKTDQRQEAIIIGYTEGEGSRSALGSLLLAVYERGRLSYIGNVGTGFSEKDLTDLRKIFSELEIKNSPLDYSPKLKAVHWVKPVLVCEIKFQEWTPDGSIRQGVFLGLREDKRPEEVMKEKPIEMKNA